MQCSRILSDSAGAVNLNVPILIPRGWSYKFHPLSNIIKKKGGEKQELAEGMVDVEKLEEEESEVSVESREGENYRMGRGGD